MTILEGRQINKSRKMKLSIEKSINAATKICEVIDSGTVAKTKISELVNTMEFVPADQSFSQKLKQIGMTDEKVATWLMELCNWEVTKTDKMGNSYKEVDGSLRAKAIEIWSKITGNSKREMGGTHNHLHLETMPDDKLLELDRKASKI